MELILYHIICQFLVDNFFDLSFWQGLATTLVGVALGIPVALLIDRCVKRFQGRKERKHLIDALRDSIKKNIDLTENLEKEFQERIKRWKEFEKNRGQGILHHPGPPTPMDLTLLNSTSLKKYESIGSISACQAIDDARYELIALNENLDLIRRMLGTALSGNDFLKAVYKVIRLCPDQISKVRHSLEKARAELGRIDII